MFTIIVPNTKTVLCNKRYRVEVKAVKCNVPSYRLIPDYIKSYLSTKVTLHSLRFNKRSLRAYFFHNF